MARHKFALCALFLAIVSSRAGDTAHGQDSEQFTVRSLAVVQNVYLEEGVTIRHLGRLRSVVGLGQSQVEVAMRAAPGELMNFSAALGDKNEESVYAYSVMVEGAVVGYEGLVFDTLRIFNMEDAWHDVFNRPEALTLNRSPDKPRLDPADKTRVLVNWGRDWPEHQGWRGWSCATCSQGATGQGTSAGGTQRAGLKGSGQTWEYWNRIVTILQRSAHAYYHFVAECLPKVLLVSKELAEYPDAVVLVDESFGGGAWTREYFELLGVPLSQLVMRSAGKVYLADLVHTMKPTPVHRANSKLLRIMSKKLVHAALQGAGSSYALDHSHLQARLAHSADSIVIVERTRKNNQHSQQHQACLATGGCRVREVMNMNELKSAVQVAFPHLQVVTFDSFNLTIRQQIELFSRAVSVVGAHGAGLTNSIFAPPGGIVLELLPQMLQRASVHMIFWHLAVSTHHLHASYIVPHNLMASDNSTSLHNFRVPVSHVVSHLRDVLPKCSILSNRLHLLHA